LSISLVSSLAAKGKGATAKDGRKGALTKVFARKKFWRRAFNPLYDGPMVLRPALRVRTHGDGLTGRTGCTHPTRRNGVAALKRRLRRRSEGVPDGTAGEAAALDLSHQTLAKPETRRDSAETGRSAAAALAEWGSTTGPRSGSGAEGGQRPALCECAARNPALVRHQQGWSQHKIGRRNGKNPPGASGKIADAQRGRMRCPAGAYPFRLLSTGTLYRMA